jgi:hypothetical protein
MTAQTPDILINELETLNIEELDCYGVIAGNPRENHGWGDKYEFKHKPNPPESMIFSANWKGYTPTYRITKKGSLELISYSYVKNGIEEIDPPEELEGDFWLMFKESFFAPRLYIPFKDGKIILEKNKWLQYKGDSWAKSKGWSGKYYTENIIGEIET